MEIDLTLNHNFSLTTYNLRLNTLYFLYSPTAAPLRLGSLTPMSRFDSESYITA